MARQSNRETQAILEMPTTVVSGKQLSVVGNQSNDTYQVAQLIVGRAS